MPEKILFVDDDANVLSGFQRILRGRFQVETANNTQHALAKLSADPEIAVIVSDYRMPGMNGVEFLAETVAEWPSCIRVLLTGEADTRAAGAAVNQGQIFRFLLKPCPALILEKTLAAALKQYRLMQGEKVLLEQTLRGSMELLVDVLSLVHPHAFHECTSIYQTIRTLLADLPVADKWEFEIAGLLSKIGHVAVPADILEKRHTGAELSAAENAHFVSHAAIAANLIGKIPRLELVARIVRDQELPAPSNAARHQLQDMDRYLLGTQLLRIALLWESYRRKNLGLQILLAELSVSSVPPVLIKAAENLKPSKPIAAGVKRLRASDLQPGMTLVSDLVSNNGLLLLAKGHPLSSVVVECLKRRFSDSGMNDTVEVIEGENAEAESASLLPV